MARRYDGAGQRKTTKPRQRVRSAPQIVAARRRPAERARPPNSEARPLRHAGNVTTFSPEGRLHQVEYAVEAINNAGTAVGLLATDGVIMAGEKQKATKLLDPPKSSEKIYKLDDHLATVVAGLTADANILINEARLAAQRYRYQSAAARGHASARVAGGAPSARVEGV